MQSVQSRSLSYSVGLHALLVLIAAFGLPALLPEKHDPVPMVMSVDLLPISEISNVRPSDKPIQEEKHAPSVKTSKPVEPTVKEKPQEKAPPEPKKAEPKPVEKSEPAPSAKPKPEEKKKEAVKPNPKEFAALLNKLKQEAKPEPKTAKDATSAEANKTKSDAPYDNSIPMSMTEKDSIRSQFIPCWRMPAGSKDPHSLAARIKMTLGPDGTVQTAELASDQAGRYASDSFFRAAADAALRAVHQCSPLKGLPPEKYGSWREMELNFDPQDLL